MSLCIYNFDAIREANIYVQFYGDVALPTKIYVVNGSNLSALGNNPLCK